MRRSELVRRLERVPLFPSPDPALEQVVTPAERAAELLYEALARGDLAERSVADLGCGTGRLALGAAWLGAASVDAYDVDASAVALGRRAAAETAISWHVGDVGGVVLDVDTVVMNPPFGAQRRGADRPFWEAALTGARAVYAFALADSRTFIERVAVARDARVEAHRPVPWTLGATFRHHRKRSVELPVDLWIVRAGTGRP